jgi:hypothetical protein
MARAPAMATLLLAAGQTMRQLVGMLAQAHGRQ